NGPRSYLFCNTTDDWRDARDFCAARGYYLVKIEDAAEQAFVTTTAGAISGEAWWIGLNDRASEGMYVWTDGTPLGAYTAWEPGQPNDSTVGGEQDCVALEIPNPSRGEPGGWNDYGCGVQAR